MLGSSPTLDVKRLSGDLNSRRPVYVDDKGNLIEATRAADIKKSNPHQPLTQLKPSTWAAVLGGC